MATKAKTKARKTTNRSRSPKGKAQTVANHAFPLECEVGFWPTHEVTVERNSGREPFAPPAVTAKVQKDGSLEVKGLKPGHYVAGAEVDGTYRYFGFSVEG